jgi:hypothetical protein
MCIDIAEETLRREPGPVGLAALFHGALVGRSEPQLATPYPVK